MNPILTTILAIWGALLSTVVFLWDIRKWLYNKPRIATRVEFHKAMEEDGEGWISYEIRNRGGRATTIEELKLVKYRDGIWGWLRFYEIYENEWVKHPDTVKLPVVLQPGELWKGHSPLSKEGRRFSTGLDHDALIAKGRLYFKIRCAHSDRLISGKVRAEDFQLRL
jgi:hypothetical protein